MVLPAKILVTGATGFAGSYLLRLLVSRGQAVRALKRHNSSFALVKDIAARTDWVEADILDVPALQAAMKGITQVYHCAALVSFQDADQQQLLQINREGTANVVNLALEAGVEKLLHVSSIAAIGRKRGADLMDEQTTWTDGKWNSPYAVSKHLAEMEVWRGVAEGLKAVIVNPSNILGSGHWNGKLSTAQMFYKIWRGLPVYPAGGTGFVDVRDVARYMVHLMESNISGERFILNAENLSFHQIFLQMAAAMEVPAPSIRVNALIKEASWRMAWLASKCTGKAPFITRQTARSSARTFFYDHQKSLTAFPFTYTPIATTIQETAAQFLESATDGFLPKALPFESEKGDFVMKPPFSA